jgi:hypothetical protein
MAEIMNENPPISQRDFMIDFQQSEHIGVKSTEQRRVWMTK